MWFPDGVWEHIRSYMPIWKYTYNKVMEELPKIQRAVFRIEYWREVRSPKYIYCFIGKIWPSPFKKMYMVKEIHDYPFFHPKPDAYRMPHGFSRAP